MIEPSPPPTDPFQPARRRWLQATLAAGGLWVGGSGPAGAATLAGGAGAAPPEGSVGLTAWVRIEPARGEVTLIVSQAEIGQGISTTLPAVLADELGADWATVTLQTAPWDPAYRNPKYGWMFTGNSESVQAFHVHLRTVGAAAREMLVAAAAGRWNVPAAECDTEASHVVHRASGRRLPFAEVAEAAAHLPVPARPALRADAALKLVGRALPRVDIPAKVNGKAVFGIDFTVPDLWVAAVRTVPEVGARLLGFDDAPARAMPGVHAVLPLPNGVAVLADRYWQARRALAAITLRSEPPAVADAVDTARREADDDRVLRDGPFAQPVAEGAPDGAAGAGFAATYRNPCAAHATMEPMNCVADARGGRCVVWAPTQGQDLAAVALQVALGLAPQRIQVHRTPAIGGGFGRRLLPDFVVQAALLSRAVDRPVKLIWDREEDMRRDFFRPASTLALRAALDARGTPTALHAQLVTPTILAPVFPSIQKTLDETGVDPSAMEGLQHLPYAFAARSVQFHLVKTPLPTSVMRTTGYGPNLFAVESFIDELARRARVDPFEMRRRLLAHHPGALALLERLRTLSDWPRPLPAGSGRGLAFAEAFGSLIGMVAEVRVRGADVKLRRVTAVVDCGRTLDPGIARAGIEGGIVFGMAYCQAEARFEQGRLRNDNLATYRLPTLATTPDLRIEFLRSERELGGVGEIGPVTLPPALANAIHAASGRRLRSMPLARHGLQFA